MNNEFDYAITDSSRSKTLSKTFLSGVFTWMFLALGMTAITAYYFASNENLISRLISPEGVTTLGWIVMLSPLGFVLLMSLGFRKLSASTLTLLFALFAIIMGMSLSFVFFTYTAASIFKTFVVTALMFGVMAFVGYTTKTDLTKFGSILFMGLIGIIIASVVNFFLNTHKKTSRRISKSIRSSGHPFVVG